MSFRGIRSVAVLAVLVTVALARHVDTKLPNGLEWTSGALRMNNIQVIGTHDSFHIQPGRTELDAIGQIRHPSSDVWHTQPPLDVQLEHMQVRSLELNVYADPHGGNYAKPLLQKLFGLPMPTDSEWMEKGAKVLRIPDLDWHTTCIRLVSCLETVKKWLDANPQSVPISVLLKLEGFPGREIESVVEHKAQHSIGWNDEMLLRSLDEEIRSVFPNDQLIVPDNIRRNGFTLEESVLLYGWPTLDSARGRIYFLMDGSVPAVRDAYIYKRASLDGRVIFTNSKPGEPDCAFQSIDYLHTTFESEPHVRKMVRMGYLVRTSADRWLDEARSCYLKRREEAFKSGAHIIATDFEDHNMGQRLPCDYVVELPHNRTAVCNQVNAPRKCNDDKIEPPK